VSGSNKAETAGVPSPRRPTIRALVERSGLDAAPTTGDAYVEAHRVAARAELARHDGAATTALWSAAATNWDAVHRPHDAAYSRWRAAQCALREGRGVVAARLLTRAAIDAREHVPLSEAIAALRTDAR
jgi:hypothetical protein